MGRYTTASGAYSTATGYETTASGAASTAMGVSTTASGTGSVALGYNVQALAEGSVALGKNIINSNPNNLAVYDLNVANDVNIGGDLNVAGIQLGTDSNFSTLNADNVYLDGNLSGYDANFFGDIQVSGGDIFINSDERRLYFGNSNDVALYWSEIITGQPALLVNNDLSFVNDNDKLWLGAASDSSITYNGSVMKINPREVGSGNLQLQSDLNILQQEDDLGITIYGFDNRSANRAEIYVDSSGYMQLNSSKGILDFTTGTGSMQLRIGTGTTWNYNHLALTADDRELQFGTGTDTKLYYDDTDFIINPKAAGTGGVRILGDVNITGDLNTTQGLGFDGNLSTNEFVGYTGDISIRKGDDTGACLLKYVNGIMIETTC
jgi:hypothetical protein